MHFFVLDLKARNGVQVCNNCVMSGLVFKSWCTPAKQAVYKTLKRNAVYKKEGGSARNISVTQEKKHQNMNFMNSEKASHDQR